MMIPQRQFAGSPGAVPVRQRQRSDPSQQNAKPPPHQMPFGQEMPIFYTLIAESQIGNPGCIDSNVHSSNLRHAISGTHLYVCATAHTALGADTWRRGDPLLAAHLPLDLRKDRIASLRPS